MTPHYYHIKKERRGVLDELERLDITIDIKITIYQNKHRLTDAYFYYQYDLKS